MIYRPTVFASVLLLAATLAGCSALESMFASDRLDYRGQSSKTPTLEVPPDLTQIQRDSRYAPQAGGAISASTFTAAGAKASTTTSSTVAPTAQGDFKIVRAGNQRWLSTSLPADKLWPQLRTFWTDLGFTLTTDSPEAGTLETNWAENRAKLPDDMVRRTLGRVFDSLYSTGERDKFRTRVERTGSGSEIYLAHYGMVEELRGALKDTTVWTTRPNDPQLEADLLQRLMVKLGAKADDAKAVVASAASTSAAPAKARTVADQPTATVQIDDTFDRAWRRVGLALDRNGFTVEDRDRSTGTYFVRYADPRTAGQDEPSFLARLFGGAQGGPAPGRYRVQVKSDGEQRSTVAITNGQGAPEPGEVGQRIAAMLVDELR